MNYEEAVDWLRAQPQHQELVRICYLDADIVAAAKRFAVSDEFQQVSARLMLTTRRGTNVVDVGCGNGIASYAFAQLGHNVWALDPDPSDKVGLGGCKRVSDAVTQGKVIPTAGTAESIPLDDKSVDIVYTRQSMHHFWNLDRGIKECARVLKAGGMFLGTREHVIKDDAEKQIFLKEHIMQPLHGGENAFTLDEYKAAFSKAGLRLIKVMGRFESVINYYPGTDDDRISELTTHVRNEKGLVAAALVKRFPYFQNKIARSLSENDTLAGRLHSFFAIKD